MSQSTDKQIEKKIKKLVYKAKNGDQEAMEQILDQLKPMRHALGKKFGNKGIEFDDLVSQIDLLIIEAIMDYDESLDPSALRHIVMRTKNGIWNYYRKEMNYFNNKKNDILIDPVELEKINNPNLSVDEEDILEKIELDKAIEKLTDRQKLAIKLYYYMDFMDSEIAEIFGIDQSNATRARQRGLLALEKLLDS